MAGIERRKTVKVRFGKRKRIQFTDQYHPKQGIISMLIGVGTVILLCVLFVLSSNAKGNAGLFVGGLGMVDLAISVFGFVLAVKCFKKEEIYVITPTLGAVFNGMMIIGCMLLYVIGAV